ncbi:MAG: hypothetical protein AN485_23955 [Anabaena sp. MDT14b]|nr:MAG: hypothetical protein AN485_23955 [Anabaena sp. MDT14b]
MVATAPGWYYPTAKMLERMADEDSDGELILKDKDFRAPGAGYRYGESDPTLRKPVPPPANPPTTDAPSSASTSAGVSRTPQFGVGYPRRILTLALMSRHRSKGVLRDRLQRRMT